MNQDHAVAGIGGTSATAMLAGVIAHFQKVDPATASAEAGLIVLALGAIVGITQAALARKPAAAPDPPHAAPGATP